jgi:hypothetical protein
MNIFIQVKQMELAWHFLEGELEQFFRHQPEGGCRQCLEEREIGLTDLGTMPGRRLL